jgi:hypothetical protein
MNKAQRALAALDAVDCEVTSSDRGFWSAVIENALEIEIGCLITLDNEELFHEAWRGLELVRRLHPRFQSIQMMIHTGEPYSIALVRTPLEELDDD